MTENNKLKINPKYLIILVIAFMILLVISTKFIGNADMGDYLDIAKFFAGNYKADIRSSHSYFYGFIFSPFVKLDNSFLLMKLANLVWLFLLMLSIYSISKKNKKTLWLILTSPIFWYMAPFINPIQIASLFFLWGFYFLNKYDKKDKIKDLFFAGIFFGLAWVFWDTILHLGIILTLVYFYNKKLSHTIYFILFVTIGLIPRLILDQLLFNFPFFTILKSFFGGVTNSLWSGVLGSGHTPKNFVNIFSTIIFIPLFSYLLYTPKYFKLNKKSNIFILLAFLLILTNPQPRYTLIIIPLIILNLSTILNEKQLKKQIIVSTIITLLIITPYIIQINYNSNVEDLTSFIANINHIQLSKSSTNSIIKNDLKKIENDYENKLFIVGNLPDDYAILARYYKGNKIQKFVSIQDYNLVMNNQTILFEKELHPIPNINERREIFIIGGLSKKTNDKTNYNDLNYAIGLGEEVQIEGFVLDKKYDYLYVSKKQ